MTAPNHNYDSIDFDSIPAIPDDGTPAEQAKAHLELHDHPNIAGVTAVADDVVQFIAADAIGVTETDVLHRMGWTIHEVHLIDTATLRVRITPWGGDSDD